MKKAKTAPAAPDPDGPRRRRSGNRREELMDRAAELIAAKGFDGASMRDIAAAVGMLPGSLYYHFPSKEDLLREIHGRVVSGMAARVEQALEGVESPWGRLEAAAEAHLAGLFETGSLVAIVSPDFPKGHEDLNEELRRQRRDYEQTFRDLFEALPLAPEADRTLLRLELFGALNWTPVWYRDGGRYDPRRIATVYVETIRRAYGTG
ncbi:MAG: TetR/AcrR family transcriptional regulator [Alphaproteobacteria bacterium]|nr:TetR/AcrR family transcriptional regulator [Alphaproteobacteria bacterium]